MSDIVAKPVIKNKFWIVEDHGKKIATIQAIDEGGFAYVHDNQREKFPSISLIKKHYNIEFIKPEKAKKEKLNAYSVYGYPSAHAPHNEIFDVQRKLPIFTKTSKSKSYFCAGYYIIKFSSTWVRAFCPKLITLNRYEYQGPYTTQEEMVRAMKDANGN